MNVLAFFAHPDDEAMLAGGVLALLASNGAAVHYLCATRGEGGELGEPPVCRREQLGFFREREMTCAVRSLEGVSLSFLDYIDPLVGADDRLFAYTDNLDRLADQVVSHIQDLNIDVVISHGSNGEYGHPAHVISHQAVVKGIGLMGETAPLFYTAAAMFLDHPRPRLANQDDPADLVLDISPVMEMKKKAAMCHQSQHALFVRRASQEAGRQLTVPDILMVMESLRRVHPVSNETGQDDLASALQDWVR